MGLNTQALFMIGLDPANDKVLLHFNEPDGYTVTVDAYGNTTTLYSNAVIETAQARFGSGSLYTPDSGTLSRLEVTGLQGNRAAWTLEGFTFTTTSWIEVGEADKALIAAQTNTGLGDCVRFWLDHVGATVRAVLFLSADGTGWGIANAVVVSPIAGLASNTWMHWAVTYDPTAQAYYSYINGALVHNVASAVQIPQITTLILGGKASYVTDYLFGYRDETRLSNVCRYPGGAAFTPPAAAFVS